MARVTRREFVKYGFAAGAGFFFVSSQSGGRVLAATLAPAQIPGGTLSPGDVGKFVLPLVKPPGMPPSKTLRKKDLYRIGVRQFTQQVLSPPLPETTVWGYGSTDYPGTVAQGGTFSYPAFSINATWKRKATVEWRNELVDRHGSFLPHLLPVDPTLHWANPPGGRTGRDTRPSFAATPGPYRGPVPIVTHLHGGHTAEESDGYPEAWYLPNARNIPGGYAETGTFYDYYSKKYRRHWNPGTATFGYRNDQRAATLWYHDHTLGMTRANVYAGLAGFYLLRGGPSDHVRDSRDGSTAILPGPAPAVGDNPLGEYGEIPIVIQDRSFNADGSLFYPDTRAFFDGYAGPYIPDTPVSPIWNPEFFGNMIVVNGSTWPHLDVMPRRYRFRLLNGCNSRFLILQFEHPGVGVWQIGSDGGFLPAPVRLNDYPYPGSTGGGATVLIGPAERADVIVDFRAAAGASFRLLNLGPDEPFGGDAIGSDFEPADPGSTGQVMEFRVASGPGSDPTTPPEYLQLPSITPIGIAPETQTLSLNEKTYLTPPHDEIPLEALLGTYNQATGVPVPLGWADPITENPALGTAQVWEMYNLTADAHPIHIHPVEFEVLGREPIGGGTSATGSNGPLPWETGFKDTVIAYPGEITRVKARFDLPGFYVWHCHIIEHEDDDMMRPYHIGPIPPITAGRCPGSDDPAEPGDGHRGYGQRRKHSRP